MAHFQRLDVYRRILEEALVPVFSHSDAPTVCRVVDAVAAAGVRVFEFTNRHDHAVDVFKALVHHCTHHHPDMVVGAGTISDAPTAALFIAHGANFIVGPSFDEGVARLCNKRRVAYLPGCQTATEIAVAEEMGAEIIKIFPAVASGGPDFLRQILGPSPRSRLMPTSIGEVTPESVAGWFDAGACAIGLGRELMPAESVLRGEFEDITRRTSTIRNMVRLAVHSPI
jgi:2-dehydro-3-deoxyphosphogluconate aldolase/(4S)-4-hydroxy-2-oxoglutarate aldolase